MNEFSPGNVKGFAVKDYASLKDGELIEQAATGDQLAFQYLVKRHSGWAYGFVVKTVRDAESAWDIVQEAFVRVYRNLSEFRQEASFNTWFHRILYNLCVDHWRRKGKRLEVEYMDTLASDDAGPSGGSGFVYKSPEKTARHREVVGLLEQALGALSFDHRTIILMREIDGMSYEEIAEILGCPKGTVMSRLHHARKNITDFLVQRGYISSEI